MFIEILRVPCAVKNSGKTPVIHRDKIKTRHQTCEHETRMDRPRTRKAGALQRLSRTKQERLASIAIPTPNTTLLKTSHVWFRLGLEISIWHYNIFVYI